MKTAEAARITGLALIPGGHVLGSGVITWRLDQEFRGIAADRLELAYMPSVREFKLWHGGHIIETWNVKKPD